MCDWIIRKLSGVLLAVIDGILVNWIWEKREKKLELKSEQEKQKLMFYQLLEKVIDEADYNCTSGIGDPKCPFRLEAHTELASNLRLPDDLKVSIKEIIYQGEMCNGGRLVNQVSASNVKTFCKLFKKQLESFIQNGS